jgi:hypothetical protein
MDNFPKLLFRESVFELVVNVLEFINGEFSSSLKVVETEVGTSSFFREWASLK